MRKLTTSEVIEQFRGVHGNFYDYSKFVYVNNRTKGIIICPHHGEFLQSPNHHKNGQGCPWCSVESRILTHEEVIQKFRGVHDNFYNYSKFVYGGNAVKGIIICPHHGEFLQSPNSHKNGHGCPRCSVESRILTHEEVIQKFRDKHEDFYDYSNFEYGGAHKKGVIICPHHGEFLQTPDSHKNGHGCPRCKAEATSKRAKGGYDNLSPEQRTCIRDVWLYHLELQYSGTIFHKVGITGDPPTRFYSIQRQSQSTILNGFIKQFSNAEIAFSREQKLLAFLQFGQRWCKKTKTFVEWNNRRSYEPFIHPIKFGGSNELFIPVPNPKGWNLDLNNIPERSPRFNYNEDLTIAA